MDSGIVPVKYATRRSNVVHQAVLATHLFHASVSSFVFASTPTAKIPTNKSTANDTSHTGIAADLALVVAAAAGDGGGGGSGIAKRASGKEKKGRGRKKRILKK